MDSPVKCVYLQRYSPVKCGRTENYSLMECDLKIRIMERLAINELLKWKNKEYRKPLIVEGARQVGKTWLVKEFARQNYRQLAYVNFEEMKILQNLFEQDFNIPRILTAIGAVTNVTCTEGDTLIFLDEIQAAPQAITSLKYFAENAPGYHVIAAGSLLGIELHQGESFPVGKVEFLPLYPMNFIEFVMAMGEKNLAQLLQTKDWNMTTMFAPNVSRTPQVLLLRGRHARSRIELQPASRLERSESHTEGYPEQLSARHVEACSLGDHPPDG